MADPMTPPPSEEARQIRSVITDSRLFVLTAQTEQSSPEDVTASSAMQATTLAGLDTLEALIDTERTTAFREGAERQRRHDAQVACMVVGPHTPGLMKDLIIQAIFYTSLVSPPPTEAP